METKKLKITKSTIPAGSLVEQYLPADYTDVYACEFASPNEISPDAVMLDFWTGGASWIKSLFRLRDFLVRFVGLKRGSESFGRHEKLAEAIRGGGSMGMMSTPAKNRNETVMKITDSHLDAFMSVHVASEGTHQTHQTHRTRRKVSVITLVNFHNTLGHIYFFFIRPFHAIIAKSLLRGAVKKAI